MKMDSPLTEKVKSLVEKEDIDGLTKLLCEWPEQTVEWLLYLEMRICAPSSSPEQKRELKRIREEATTKNPDLLEVTSAAVYDEKEVETTVENKITEVQEQEQEQENFSYTDQERAEYAIIERLEEFDNWELEELDGYLGELDYLSLGSAIQHLINQAVYALVSMSGEYPVANKITDTTAYKKWNQLYAPTSILNNSEFNLQNLVDLSSIEDSLSLIKSKDYYAYLLASGRENRSFDSFRKNRWGSNSFNQPTSSTDIKKFEETHGVSFPPQLKELYLAVSNDDFSLPCNIPNLRELEHSLSADRPNYEQLKGLGLVNMLDYVWSNDKDDFKPEEGSITQAQIDFLNTHYTAIGYLNVDDDTNIVIYFDDNKQFGAVWYCQDGGLVFNELDFLIDKSQAQYSLYQLLAAIPLTLENKFHEYEGKEGFIASLRVSYIKE